MRRHGGNAEVVRQELKQEHGVEVSLRTVERAVAPLRRELQAEARATVRYETPPGKQLQIDFGEKRIWIGDERVRVQLFVATLGYSRRNFVQPFRHQRQSAWFQGMEGAFRHWGGVAEQVLVDNARALVTYHNPETREVRYHERFVAFCRYWGVQPRACAPYRPQTKGKDESGVGYVKRNAIAGRAFDSWAALEGHLVWWMREIADVRVHGTTGEAPLVRFHAAEAAALAPLAGRAPFVQVRELQRKVHNDACIEVDTCRYSVPWQWIGASMQVLIAAGTVTILHGGIEVARHPEASGRRQRRLDPAHLAGIVGAPKESGRADVAPVASPATPVAPTPALLRPLSDYEAVIGGAW